MPALGNRGPIAPRKIREAAKRPAPPIRRVPAARPTARPHPATVRAQAFSRGLPQQPFAPAQRQAQRKVQRTTRAIPVTPHPYIPRLPNPTPHQTTVALHLIRHSQQQALGPKPSAARIREYHQELASDPRLREFRQTIEHYARHAEGHQATVEGRRAIAGRETIARGGDQERPERPGWLDALYSAAAEPFGGPRPIAARELGRKLIAGGRAGQATAKAGRPPKDLNLPLLGTAHVSVPYSGQVVKALGSALASATPGLQGNTPEAKVFKSIPSDLAAIGTWPIVAGYGLASAAGQSAIKRDLGPLEQFGKQLAEGASHGALGAVARGDWKGLEKAFREHLVLSALELEGARTVPFRAAGAVARTVSKGKVASRVGPAVAMSPEQALVRAGAHKQITLSGDPLRAIIKRHLMLPRERMMEAQAGERARALKPVKVYDRGRLVDVRVPSHGKMAQLQRQRMNFTSSRRMGMERNERNVARQQTLVARTKPGRVAGRLPAEVAYDIRPATGGRLVPTKVEGKPLPITTKTIADHLSVLVSDGTISSVRTFDEDLAKEWRETKRAVREHAHRHDAELASAQENLAILTKARESQRIAKMKRQIVAQGLAQSKALNEVDPELAKHQIHPAEELNRARLSQIALAHMPGVRYTTEQEHAQLERKAAVEGWPRQEQIALSGRHVGLTMAHEAAQAQKAGALKAMKAAHAKVAGLEKRLAAKKGAARRSQGGRPGETRAPMRRADAKQIRELETQLEGLRAQAKESVKVHREAAAAVRENPLPERRAALRVNGKLLRDEDIEKFARSRGRDPNTLAYLPHRLTAVERRSYHKQFRPENRPVTKGQTRTGHLFERRARSFHPDLIRDELTRKRTIVVSTQQIDKFISENTVKHPAALKAERGEPLSAGERRIVEKGGLWNAREGVEESERLIAARPDDKAAQLVPIRVVSAKLPPEMKGEVGELQSTLAMEGSRYALLNDRLDVDMDSSARNLAMVSKASIDRLQDHLRSAGEVERMVQMMAGPFRMAVLPQPKWLTGQFVEPYLIRLPLSGSGAFIPGLAVDLRATSRLMKSLRAGDDAEKWLARELETQFGGLFIGARGAVVRRTFEDFDGWRRAILKLGHDAREKIPVFKVISEILLAIPRSFFHLNRVIEGVAQRAAFGHVLRRDMQEATGSWLKAAAAGEEALAEAKRGLFNTAAQHRFMEAQYEMLGQYDGWSPFLKTLMQGWTPFLPWVLAATRFVYWTVPVHHTAAFTALVNAARPVMAEWERLHAPGVVPPGELRWSPGNPEAGFSNILRATPYSGTIPLAELFRGEPSELASYPGYFLPEVSGIREGALGLDPFQKPLQVAKTPGNPKGKPSVGDLALYLARQATDVSIPGVALAERIFAGGGTEYANSVPLLGKAKTKPGTKHESGLARALLPVRKTYLKAERGGAYGRPKGGGSMSLRQQVERDHTVRQSESHLSLRQQVEREERRR